jgi:DNA mismatch endonuclease, patch repair protein
MDRISAERRSALMARVRAKHTRTELVVRRLVYALGYRYRLHAADLPGKPDIVFRSRKKVIFVHGCFWHGHDGCARPPVSRPDYWLPKLARNRARDAAAQEALKERGWSVAVVWQCELRNDPALLAARLTKYLGPPAHAERGPTDTAFSA